MSYVAPRIFRPVEPAMLEDFSFMEQLPQYGVDPVRLDALGVTLVGVHAVNKAVEQSGDPDYAINRIIYPLPKTGEQSLTLPVDQVSHFERKRDGTRFLTLGLTDKDKALGGEFTYYRNRLWNASGFTGLKLRIILGTLPAEEPVDDVLAWVDSKKPLSVTLGAITTFPLVKQRDPRSIAPVNSVAAPITDIPVRTINPARRPPPGMFKPKK